MLAVGVDLHHEVVAVLERVDGSPDCTAPPIPRLNGWRTTFAPARSATAAVSSVDPSSITITSQCGAWRRSERITSRIVCDSLYAGTTASRLVVRASIGTSE